MTDREAMAMSALRQALEQPSDSVEQKPVVLNQFLSDVMTAAGLVKHGKQSKALAARLQVEVMKLHTALRAALEQPEQEPFGYFHYDLGLELWQETGTGDGKPLYTAPPKRDTESSIPEGRRPEWVGLTDDEFTAIARKYSLSTRVGLEYFKDELEAKLKEKNT